MEGTGNKEGRMLAQQSHGGIAVSWGMGRQPEGDERNSLPPGGKARGKIDVTVERGGTKYPRRGNTQ